jgi:hypothetical protein
MTDKLFVNKNDPYRVLLTEVLPYEVPIIFSNELLYRFASSDFETKAPELIKRIFDKNISYTIPFDYHIWQGNRNRRTLSLIHPGWQLKFPSLYQNYAELIIFLCSKSPFSLRRPSRTASYYFERDFGAEDDALKGDAPDQEPDPFGEQSTHAASYFFYATYSQLYRFIDSHEFLSLEKRFPVLLKFDIKRCFPSIYTHSISWAVQGKEFSKKNIGAFSFGSEFDNLMQGSNYRETNGIVIGPEFSRIFAEVILQQIDLDILNSAHEAGIVDTQFEIRRYVDDYFVFAKEEKIAKRLMDLSEASLQRYKLYINESKTEVLATPFSTPQTIAKTDVMNVLGESLFEWLDYLRRSCTHPDDNIQLKVGDKIRLHTPYKVATRLIRDLKIAVKRSGMSYEVVTGYALGSITRKLYRLQKALNEAPLSDNKHEEFQNILLIAIELVFFFYSMDFRVRTTYFVSQFMLLLSRSAKFNKYLQALFIFKIRQNVQMTLDALPRDSTIGVEVLNLLIALKTISPDTLLSPEYLSDLMRRAQPNALTGSVNEFISYNYFDFVVILYYIKDSNQHDAFKARIEEEIVRRFSLSTDIGRRAELCFLLLDVLACPHVSDATKRQITSMAFKDVLGKTATVPQIGEVVNYVKKALGFVNWKAEIGLEKLLRKKQLNPPY